MKLPSPGTNTYYVGLARSNVGEVFTGKMRKVPTYYFYFLERFYPCENAYAAAQHSTKFFMLYLRAKGYGHRTAMGRLQMQLEKGANNKHVQVVRTNVAKSHINQLREFDS